MTIDEAIFYLKTDRELKFDSMSSPEVAKKNCTVIAYDMAIAALEKQMPKSELSIEQLKDLPLCEWVWIEVLVPFNYQEKVSAYYCKQEDYTHDRSFCCGYPGLSFSFDYADYNKTWTAYTHQPKECQ